MSEIRNIADEIRARGHDYRARVIQNEATRANAETAPLLEVPVGTKLFHSIIVHHEAEFPIQVEERFVLASVAPDYGSLDFTQMTPNDYLSRTAPLERSEEHTSELQSLMRTSYAVCCLKKKKDEDVKKTT